METRKHFEDGSEIERQFIERLKRFGYPEDKIIQVSRNKDLPGDIVIKNGDRYIQAFEIKNNVKACRNNFSQYVEFYKIDIPVFCVVQNNGRFEYYCNGSSIGIDEREVLNFEKATDSFVRIVKNETTKNNRCFKIICFVLAVLFFIVGLLYFLKSLCDSAYLCGTVGMSIVVISTVIIPFSNKFCFKVGDLGLEYTFNHKENRSNE